MITLRILTNPDQTLWEDHTFETMEAAQFAVNHGGEGNPLNPESLDQQWGFRIYDERGVCFHSDSGEGLGETK
jgi:hypothetical protein